VFFRGGLVAFLMKGACLSTHLEGVQQVRGGAEHQQEDADAQQHPDVESFRHPWRPLPDLGTRGSQETTHQHKSGTRFRWRQKNIVASSAVALDEQVFIIPQCKRSTNTGFTLSAGGTRTGCVSCRVEHKLPGGTSTDGPRCAGA